MKIDKINNTNFNAVNQKYLKKAIKEYNYLGSCTGELMECLRTDVYFKDISPRDGIDTLEAIRPYAPRGIKALNHIKDGFEYLLKHGYDY